VVTKYTAFTESTAQKYKLISGTQKQEMSKVYDQSLENEKSGKETDFKSLRRIFITLIML